jgi:hypothetical protein
MRPINDTVFYCVLRRFDRNGCWHKCETFTDFIDAKLQIERNRSTSEGEFMLAELRHSFTELQEE